MNGAETVWLSSSQTAGVLGLHKNTVKRIPPELPYWRATPRGDRRYARADVLAYIERRMVR